MAIYAKMFQISEESKGGEIPVSGHIQRGACHPRVHVSSHSRTGGFLGRRPNCSGSSTSKALRFDRRKQGTSKMRYNDRDKVVCALDHL